MPNATQKCNQHDWTMPLWQVMWFYMWGLLHSHLIDSNWACSVN